MQGIQSILGRTDCSDFRKRNVWAPEGWVSMGRQNAGNSKHSGADRPSGVSQDEGLSTLGPGQYGWPECKEFQAFWGGQGVVGVSQGEGLSALGRGQYGWQECKEFHALCGRTGVVGFSQAQGWSVLGRGQYGWPECKE